MSDRIITQRLVLRPLGDADATRIAALIGDLTVARWLTLVPHPYGVPDARKFIADNRDGARVWAITMDGSLIGVISIKDELGYWLGEAFWGQGVMTEAATAVVADHFSRSEDTLGSGYHLGNDSSCRVLTKLGFFPTGTRSAFAHALGHEVTIQGMKLTHAAWKQAA